MNEAIQETKVSGMSVIMRFFGTWPSGKVAIKFENQAPDFIGRHYIIKAHNITLGTPVKIITYDAPDGKGLIRTLNFAHEDNFNIIVSQYLKNNSKRWRSI